MSPTLLGPVALSLLLAGAPASATEPEAPEGTGAVRGPTLPARLLHGVAPVHPDGPGGRRASFRVLVHLDAEGAVDDLHLPDDMPSRFRHAAQVAIEASTFAPVLRDGAAVPGDILLEVVFEPPAPGPDDVEVIEVESHRDDRPRRSVSDVRVVPSDVQAVPTPSAADLLELAPGIVVTPLGGEAHPPAIFLRGFDARHGQDIAFSVDGVPLNQVGNPHGHGLTDLTAIMPEAVRAVRVQEAPLDPAQRDFAVAGSVDFELGMEHPGFLLKGSYGSWNTGRAVVGWRHARRPGTFVAAEVFRTDGYGDNRGALRGSGLARVDGAGAIDWHVVGGFMGSSWDSAGLVRWEDVEAGRLDLYGTQDRAQGGASQQGFVAAGFHRDEGDTTWRVDLGGIGRNMILRDNYTGFLLDVRRPGESPHPQRGDLLEQTYRGWTLWLDGAARHAWRGAGLVSGAIEAGVYGRLDDVDGASRRLRALDQRPYRTEASYGLLQAEVAAWAGGELTLADVFTIRAGARLASFFYRLHDHCAAAGTWFPGAEADTLDCPTVDRYGPIAPDHHRRAHGLGVAPRASLELKLPKGHTLLGGAGRGLRSLEARALSDDEQAPFGDAWAGEVGWEHKAVGDVWTSVHRVAGFTTHVRRDLIFDEVEGGNVYGGSTARWGASVESEVHAGGFTGRTTLTYTYAVFGDDLPPRYTDLNTDRQPGMLVPYVPPVVLRSDLSYRARLGRGFELRPGAALTWLAPRPLPQSQRGEHVATLDLSASARWRGVELGVVVTNVTNARYPLAEYGFSSWFPDASGASFPTRVPSRQVSPGAPLGVLATLTVRPGLF